MDDEELERRWSTLETITAFDGVGDFQQNPMLPKPFMNGLRNAKIQSRASTPVSLLVESLVQQLCSMLEPNQEKASSLYLLICSHLHKLRLIDETYAMGELDMMRAQFKNALVQLVSVARGDVAPVAMPSVWPLPQPIGLEWSRYHREFEEIGFLASGGFGKVFKARNKLDSIVYAVKKITIKSTTVNNVLLHLAEVKTLASLNHPNIVPYKAAWLEPLLVAETPAKFQASTVEITEDSSSDSSSMEGDEEESSRRNRHDLSDSLRLKDNSDGFSIHFEGETNDDRTEDVSESSNSALLCKYRDRQISIEESQPHLKLKWATLYIQMTLCHTTLREFLDRRNQAASFDDFYADFIREERPESTPINSPRTPSEGSVSGFRRKPSEGGGSERRRGSSTSSSNSTDDSATAEASLLPFDRPPHAEVVADIFTQHVNGLNYIHSRGIVHHDIKPSNIFVSVEASGKLVVQLGDFGLACPLQSDHDTGGLGTPLYAAPEQLAGECDPKSDIYSLGIVLLELLVPLATDMERAETIKAARRGHLPDAINTGAFPGLLRRLIQQRPARRPDTTQLIELLGRLGGSKEDVISDLQRRLSAREQEIQTLMAQIDEQRRDKADDLRDKEVEIEMLRARILEMDGVAKTLQSKDEEIDRLRKLLGDCSRDNSALS